MNELILRRPDDFHLHLRDGAALARTVADASRQCGRALVMPNLVPPVDTLEALRAYRERIEAAIPAGRCFTPLMSLYLSAHLTPAIIRAAPAAGVLAVKWYPKGATTNSAAGVGPYEALRPLLAEMERQGLLLLIHGEVTDDDIDIFSRESTFIERTLTQLRREFPGLKVVLEHITTAFAVDYLRAADANLAATITAQHLLANRNDLLVGGLKPHFYCLPILKTEADRRALLGAATSGDRRFFLGSDSAPHGRRAKENACGCAGCYTGATLLELYATAFDSVGALDKLEDFASRHGADYYGLPRSTERVRLERREQTIPATLPFGDDELIPFWAGRRLAWTLTP